MNCADCPEGTAPVQCTILGVIGDDVCVAVDPAQWRTACEGRKTPPMPTRPPLRKLRPALPFPQAKTRSLAPPRRIKRFREVTSSKNGSTQDEVEITTVVTSSLSNVSGESAVESTSLERLGTLDRERLERQEAEERMRLEAERQGKEREQPTRKASEFVLDICVKKVAKGGKKGQGQKGCKCVCTAAKRLPDVSVETKFLSATKFPSTKLNVYRR